MPELFERAQEVNGRPVRVYVERCQCTEPYRTGYGRCHRCGGAIPATNEHAMRFDETQRMV